MDREHGLDSGFAEHGYRAAVARDDCFPSLGYALLDAIAQRMASSWKNTVPNSTSQDATRLA